ncbi:MAG: D-Ala-D-Ala carboxypeptidase family metallohydrolase [Bacteroidaceae bacterium]|nr:D-Ala-D-Ala carboxypeptidase family metallohydrolase [Bacteroidaceae bacterium]
MKKKKNFTMNEMCRSTSYPQLAAKQLPLDVAENLFCLCCYILQPLREAMQFPIIITSGYRPKELNKVVGGVPNSWHLKGLAADIDCGKAKNQRIYDWLKAHQRIGDMPIAELLWEGNGKWVHVALG